MDNNYLPNDLTNYTGRVILFTNKKNALLYSDPLVLTYDFISYQYVIANTKIPTWLHHI